MRAGLIRSKKIISFLKMRNEFSVQISLEGQENDT